MRSAPLRKAIAVARPLGLLIVDESVGTRAVLRPALERDPAIEIVDSVSSAEQALTVLDETRVDIVLLDLEMPGTDGLTALPAIIERGLGARVFVLSSSCHAGSRVIPHALALGAADTCAKPQA